MIGRRLKEIRSHFELNQSDFAAKLGLGQSTYAGYETEKRSVPDEIKEKISHIGINLHWLITGQGKMLLSDNNRAVSIQTEKKEIVLSDRDDVVMVPVLEQKISAGAGQDYIEEYSSDVTIPILDKIIHPYPRHSIKVVEVRGDSMTGVEIFDGDYVIFSQGELRADGIYVISIGSDLFVKRLEFDPIERKLTIISENPSYEKKVVDADSDVVRVEGKVIGWIHRHPY